MHGTLMSRPAYTDQVYSSPGSFSSVYLSGTTLTLAGLPFTPDDSQFLMTIVTTAGGAVNRYPVDSYFHDYDSATGILTVAGANFLASDRSIRVVLLGEARAFAAAGNYYRQTEVAPVNTSAVISETLVDTTNLIQVPPATPTVFRYPSNSGLDMLGYRSVSFSGKILDADAVITLWFEVSDDEDSAAEWHRVFFYDNINNAVVNGYSVTNGTLTYACSLDDCNFQYVRAVLTIASDDNTEVIKMRRVY